MSTEITNPSGANLTTGERSKAVTESLKRFARIARQSDRKQGIRAYRTHVKRDPVIPLLFLLVFVLPTLTMVGYLYLVASDRYVTEARFALRPALGNVDKVQSEKTGEDSSLPKQMIIQDTIITANYIDSRQMVETLEKQLPVREMFTRDSIDMFSRGPQDAPIERFMRYWSKRVATSIDTHSGIVTLTVSAFDPEESYKLAQALLAESERKMNELSIRARNAAVGETNRELAHAEQRMIKTRMAVRELRNAGGVLDAAATNTTNLTMISELRKQRIDLAVQLTLGLRDLGPDTRPIRDIKTQIRDLDENIEKIERQMATTDPNQKKVLADLLSQFEAYDNQRKDAEDYYSKVLAANEAARILAARQIEFFTPVVEPIVPVSSTEPKRALWSSICALAAMALFGLSVVIRKYVFS
ncbi:capsule biosynthesis protein [Methylorubrum salsuginis]|uniref:Capsular polysaccharide transport system permease protein n=1 Tax=Methylorubrum salsuginis TaxID=414703 RepID=A0A1I4A4K0_9HYPH|nr:capsule biosynthesis protein [Methylorubrum salsuginis]SFK50709.1 capsular polysaccharide transport system permease protein [Methylorubrum salsuginis]